MALGLRRIQEKANTLNSIFDSVYTIEDLTTTPQVSKKEVEVNLSAMTFEDHEIDDSPSKLDISHLVWMESIQGY